ncbi:hypothetical protein HUG12_00260 [Halorarum salinum]|uniref:Uncharacterized protein n=1 Tax=Halorarum salinum TaxID=2743089 RepID=A0A7D5L8C5_9EURY|nr:hypothetical protein HUG12_00260 [Halobaculum salinum]
MVSRDATSRIARGAATVGTDDIFERYRGKPVTLLVRNSEFGTTAINRENVVDTRVLNESPT